MFYLFDKYHLAYFFSRGNSCLSADFISDMKTDDTFYIYDSFDSSIERFKFKLTKNIIEALQLSDFRYGYSSKSDTLDVDKALLITKDNLKSFLIKEINSVTKDVKKFASDLNIELEQCNYEELLIANKMLDLKDQNYTYKGFKFYMNKDKEIVMCDIPDLPVIIIPSFVNKLELNNSYNTTGCFKVFNFSKNLDTKGLFSNIGAIYLDLTDFKLYTKSEDYTEMFAYCYNLVYIDFGDAIRDNSVNVKYIDRMFYHDEVVKELDFRGFNFKNVKNLCCFKRGEEKRIKRKFENDNLPDGCYSKDIFSDYMRFCNILYDDSPTCNLLRRSLIVSQN